MCITISVYVSYCNYICTSYIFLRSYIYFAIVLPILKKRYARLCHSLPQNYETTIGRVNQLAPVEFPTSYLDWLRALPSTEQINEEIISSFLCAIKTDNDVFIFCEVMENLVDEIASKNLIESLRSGNFTCDA